MKNITRLGALVLTIGLSACVTSGPVNVVHKTGSTKSQRLAAFDNCKIASFKEIPQAIGTEISGGYSTPGTVQCDSSGGYTTCSQVGGINVPATSTSYDLNDGLRNRYINRCLARKGYDTLSRPICTSKEDKQFISSTANNQPPASQISCSTAELYQ